ncbi:MAG: tRNA glutamyl-Q(34) synthetase GluQRS [Planctomycetota bacterium]|jgi:glutamyl-tRNA synthetase|nr:tRNA glutamyl-Q(34) synthetase GluQRS [Planctomycetota bacterium]
MKAPVGRLAPSPTGVLHLGNARSFLLAWLDIRARGGSILLRIEDLDGPRVRAGAEQAAIEDLQWLGLDWDVPLVRQSERLPLYRQALQQLQKAGRAYRCICSRKDVEQAASAPHLGEEGPIYPGTCKQGIAGVEHALPPNYRFHVAPSNTRFHDRFVGDVAYNVAEQLGDFVIWKRDDEPAYQLAVVVDDAAMGITDVLRGDDLLSSAARQTQVYEALGLSLPNFAHTPLIVGKDGRRLAKRHGDTSLHAFREQGVAAETVVGWLAWKSGLQDSPAPVTAAELVSVFDLQKVPQRQITWHGSFSA